jgi:hypothetical protein
VTDQSDANGITNVTAASLGPTQFTVGLRFTDGTARSTTHTISWQAWA